MKKIFYTICLAFLFFVVGCTTNVENTHNISKTYTISFNEKGGSDVDDIVLKYGDEILLPSCEKEGYRFIGWMLDGELFQEEKFDLEKDIKLVAKWGPLYTINFRFANIEPLEVYGSRTVYILPEVSDSDFLGWYYYDDKVELPFTYDGNNEEIVLQAKYRNRKFAFIVDGWKIHELSDTEVEICGGGFEDGILVIPEMVDNRTVVAIADKAFQVYDPTAQPLIESAPLTKVVLPDTIKRIGQSAFRNQKNLVTINMPSSLEIIDKNAFEYCESLSSIVFNDKLRVICSSAFSGCTSIKEVVISQNVEEVGWYAFASCTGLNYVKISGNQTLGPKAFMQCYMLEELDLSECSGIIHTECFSCCQSLKTVKLGTHTSIDEGAFRLCMALTEIIIPDTVIVIYEDAFYGCSQLKVVTLGSSLEEIKDRAFEECLIQIINNKSKLILIKGDNNYGGIAKYAQTINQIE